MKQRNVLLPALVLAAALGAVAAPAAAQGLRPATAFVQGGVGKYGLGALSAGVAWPWAWRTSLLGGELTARTELFATAMRAHEAGGGNQSFLQLGLVPMVRYGFDGGRSPWFVEAGIGLSVMDRLYATPERSLSTRWNFSDNFAVGRSFGANGQHEVSLRWQHTSNAGIKKPNPGLDLLMLRYATGF